MRTVSDRRQHERRHRAVERLSQQRTGIRPPSSGRCSMASTSRGNRIPGLRPTPSRTTSTSMEEFILQPPTFDRLHLVERIATDVPPRLRGPRAGLGSNYDAQ